MKTRHHFFILTLLTLFGVGCTTAVAPTPSPITVKPSVTSVLQASPAGVEATATSHVGTKTTATPENSPAPGTHTPIIPDPSIPDIKGTQTPPASENQATPTLRPAAPTNTEPRAFVRVSELSFSHRASPRGSYVAYQEIRVTDATQGVGPQPSHLLVAVPETDAYWEAINRCPSAACEYTWTSAEQLLWLDDGQAWIADGDSANRRDLAAPEAILEIIGISPQDVAVLRGESSLWRLALPDGTWDEVPAPALLMRNLPSEFPLTNDRLHMTADGQEAKIIHDNQILFLPLGLGTPPIVITTFEPLTYPSSDAPPAAPPVPLGGSGYWLPERAVTDSTMTLLPRWMVLNERDGSQVPLADVLGMGGTTSEPGGTGPRGTIYGASRSPDGRWLAVSIEDPALPAGQATYLASSSNLTGGRTIPAIFQGWRGDSGGVILIEAGTDVWRLVYLRLDSGRPASAISDDAPSANSLRFDTAASRVITVSSTRVVAYGGETELGAIAFQAETRLPLSPNDPATGLAIPPYVADMTDRRAYFVAGAPQGQEGMWLWVWDLPN